MGSLCTETPDELYGVASAVRTPSINVETTRPVRLLIFDINAFELGCMLVYQSYRHRQVGCGGKPKTMRGAASVDMAPFRGLSSDSSIAGYKTRAKLLLMQSFAILHRSTPDTWR